MIKVPCSGRRRVPVSAFMVMAFFVLLAASGCSVVPSFVKPPLQDEGEVYAYLQPFPHEAARLRFTIGQIVAIRSDGSEFPLALSGEDLDGSGVQRQRLLASGRVPPGQYIGMATTIKQAVLSGEKGTAALLKPEGPVKTDFSFEVQRKQTLVLTLSLRYAESVQSGFRFSPVFSVRVPSRPMTGLTGYGINRSDDTITTFDKKSGEVAAVMSTGRGPEAVVIDQKAGRAYVSLSGEDAVDVLDVTAGSVINRIHLNAGDGPREVSLTPDGRSLLVLNAFSRTLSIVDPSAFAELGRLPLGEGPRSVLIDRTGKRAYVFNELSNTITVVDIATRVKVVTLSVDTGPIMGQFNRKGDKLYVIHGGSPYLSVINPFTLAIDRKVFVGLGLSAIKVDTATDLFYVSWKQDARIQVFDPFSLLPGDYIMAMSGIEYMTIDGEENNLYLVSPEMKMIMTVNLISRKITMKMDAGESPTWVTMMGER
jgi:YVTN family beta-propeller protein